MSKGKHIFIAALIDPDMLDKVDECVANSHGKFVTRSQFVRLAIDEFLKMNSPICEGSQ